MKKGNTTKYEILALLVLAFIVLAARNVPEYVSEHIWGYGECWASDCHEKRFSEDSLYCKKHQEEADKKGEEREQSESTESSSYSSSTYSTSTTRPSSTKKPYHYDSSSSSSYRTNRVTRVRPRAKNRIRILMNPTTKDMRMCMRMAIMTMTGIIVIRIMQMEWTMR